MATATDKSVETEENTLNHDSQDNVNNNSSNKSDHSAATVTDSSNASPSPTDMEKESQLEDEIKDEKRGVEVSGAGEKIQTDNVPMDTSEIDNTSLVTNPTDDKSSSEGSDTKDDNLDTRNNNNIGHMCRNGDTLK